MDTTQIYTQVSIRHLQQIHAATHPAATNTVNRDDDTQQFLDNALADAAAVGDALSKEELLAVLEQEVDLENRPDAHGDFS